MIPTRGTVENLNSITELDHPFTVHADGMVTDAPAGVYAPEVIGDETTGRESIEGDGWEFASYGYSGQHGTTMASPGLHDSETLSGALARDVLAAPGTYVCVPVYWPGDDGEDVPADWPVQPVDEVTGPARNYVVCCDCERTWDDSISTSMTPAPSGRCPFESFHDEEDTWEGWVVLRSTDH